MSQWDNIELSHAIEYKQRVQKFNLEASAALPLDQQHISTKTTKVLNRRTGIKHERTIHAINESNRKACITRYWLRAGKSNSLQFEFRQVQNLHKVTQD